MPQTSDAHMAAVIAKLTTQTGRSLEDWVELLRLAGLPKFKEQVDWLKQVHGVGHVAAQVIAWEATKGPDYVEPTPEDWLAKQYAGPKAGLVPVYDRLVEMARALGDDVTLKVCMTYVALVRGRQFAAIQPSTKTRVDLGLILPGTEPGGRLQPVKNVGSGRTTHQVAIATPEAADQEVAGWLKAAYEFARQ